MINEVHQTDLTTEKHLAKMIFVTEICSFGDRNFSLDKFLKLLHVLFNELREEYLARTNK